MDYKEVDSKLLRKYRLTPLNKNKKNITKQFVGFDVETYGDNNDFMSGGLYWEDKHGERFKYFDNGREEMIEYILRHAFTSKSIVATNLDFDLTVLFHGTSFWNDLKIITRNGTIMYAEYELKTSRGKIRFYDTMNYAPYGVATLGDILGIPKGKKPSYLGLRTPNTLHEALKMREYNKQDCLISKKFMDLLQHGINAHGGELKISSASTSLDIWRRGYMKRCLYKEEMFIPDVKEHIFNAYYGGRTETFKRGKFSNAFYYDINSLYPSVMRNKLPLPQSVKEIKSPNEAYIYDYEGVSTVSVYCPYMKYPILPYRTDDKLIFPYGRFTATYNHNELRYALQKGYVIQEVHKQIVYEETFSPFKDFVEDMYSLRKEYKKDNNNMQVVIKLIMNSLYGKFAQKKVEDFSMVDTNNMTDDQEVKLIQGSLIPDDAEYKNGVYYFREEKEFNGKHSFPILSSYITSYARILMHPYIEKYEALYTDTDSIITMHEIPDSSRLGEMKLEKKISSGYVVKPKFYMVDDDPKVKGLSGIDTESFIGLLDNKSVSRNKFSKLRESFRRGLNVNQKIVIEKTLSLEDTKRSWNGLFNKFDLQDSHPIEVFNEY